MDKKFDLGFGNSVCVRQAFLDIYNSDPIIFTEYDLSKFDYPDHIGNPELIETTRKVIKRQLGLDYKYVLLTNGATGGVVISLIAFAQKGFEFCQTRFAPNYLRYPDIIKTAGLTQIRQSDGSSTNDTVALLDIPSNPLGTMDNPFNTLLPTILDGVYYNNVYTTGNIKPLAHDILVGSYSKLLGINGIRVGWIALNDDLLYQRIKKLVISNYCGLSVASSTILNKVLKDFRWDLFEEEARDSLDLNREEWSKLEKYFGSTPVIDRGMFYYSKMDAQCNKLMKKTGVIWSTGSSLGTDDSFGRFNLGQSNQMIREVVREVLKNDKIK